MKRVANGTDGAGDETRERAGLGKIGGCCPADRPDDHSKRHDGDDRNGEETFKPLVAQDDFAPVGAGREGEADGGKSHDRNEWQDEERHWRLSLAARPSQPDQENGRWNQDNHREGQFQEQERQVTCLHHVRANTEHKKHHCDNQRGADPDRRSPFA